MDWAAFGQTSGAFGQQQQQPAANPIFGGFGTTGGCPQDFAHQSMVIFISSGGTFGLNPPDTTSVFGAPKPITGPVPPERLVQADLDPQLVLPLRVRLSSRAPQGLLETTICLVTNLGLEQVNTFL